MAYLSLIIGFLFILFAIFAHRLGFDNNAAWGTGRYLLFFLGLGLCAVFAAPRLLRKLGLWEKLCAGSEKIWRAAAAPFAVLSRPLQFVTRHTTFSILLAGLTLALVSGNAFWYASQARFPAFRAAFNPYVELGEAFLHGQAALLEQPDPRLAAMKDPVNDYAGRQNIPYHFDLSYYNGKYYAYWGPVPALLNAAVEAVTGQKPAGALAPLIFYTCSGLALAAILFVTRWWAYPRAPGISIAWYLLAALVNIPYMFMFNRNDVYETAILTGQCCLLIGLAGWLAYLVTHRPGWLILAGTGYALAVGARYNLLLAVLVCLGFAAWEFWREGFFSRASLRASGILPAGFRRAALLLAPLALMAVSLLFYNYARFGNPLETGLRYQLAEPQYQKQYYSASYIPSNLYVYLFNPAAIRYEFPFIFTPEIAPENFPQWARLIPGKAFEQAMLGGLRWIPVIWAWVLIVPLLVFPLQRRLNRSPEEASGLHSLAARRFILMLFLAGAIEAVHTLVYYYGAMRFIADFYTLFLLAMVFLSWEADDRLACSAAPIARLLRVALWLGIIGLTFATALIGFLSSFEIPPQVFRQANPAVYNQVAGLFNRLAAVVYRILDNPTVFGTLLRAIVKILW